MNEILNPPAFEDTATKRLLLSWRPEQVITSTALRKLGVSERLTTHLRKQGILVSLGIGVYKKNNENPPWSAGVYALQEELLLPIHVGGKSALEAQGIVQYLAMGSGACVWLFTEKMTNIPKWFRVHDWRASMRFTQSTQFSQNLSNTLRSHLINGFYIRVSCRERAILEAIILIGKAHRFEEIDELFEGLTTLDPYLLQKLLEGCDSIRVRRIFLYLARKHNHPWFNRIEETKIYLGKGKREVVKGGMLDERYLITVPRIMETPDV